MKRTTKLVLFDIDGTLIRTGGAGVRAFEKVFAEVFERPDATKGVQFSGRTDTSLVRECLERSGVEPTAENFARFFEAYYERLAQLLPQLEGEACPGVTDLLRALREIPDPPELGLLTGNVRRGAELKLSHYDLWHHFPFGAFGDDHEERDQLARIARARGGDRLGRELAGDEILVIGDTPLDIQCARAVGARCLAVATGGCSFELLQGHAADWVLQDLRGVLVETLCA